MDIILKEWIILNDRWWTLIKNWMMENIKKSYWFWCTENIKAWERSNVKKYTQK